MFRRSLIVSALFISISAVTLSACSSDTTPTGPTTGSQTITAASGGTLAAAGATVTIPAGALAADTTITFAQKAKAGMPSESDIAAPIYEFGPDGTKFLKPVTLKMDFAGTAPTGKAAKLAWLNTTTNTWTVLADSAVSGSAVTASTDHFTAFTVVFLGTGEQIGGGCDAIPFTPCGGNIVGKWQYEASCATAKGGIKGFESCPTAMMAVTIDISGSATFGADGNFANAGTVATSIKSTVPKSCLPQGATCASLKAEELGDACVGSQVQPTKDNTSTSTYSTSGNKLIINNGKNEQFEYCVSGSTLTVKLESTDVTVLYKAKKI